ACRHRGGAWRRPRTIRVPLLRPVTLLVFVTGIISAFQVFPYVYVLTGGGPGHATDVVAYRLYQAAWAFLQFGSASALSLLLFVVLFGATWGQLRLLVRRVQYDYGRGTVRAGARAALGVRSGA